MLEKLAGPIIGALIGYCTNYIAVKMLFYPKQEVRIFGRKLPFTPGAIPKGKPRLARAIGIIVADDLLTEDDIKQKMLLWIRLFRDYLLIFIPVFQKYVRPS